MITCSKACPESKEISKFYEFVSTTSLKSIHRDGEGEIIGGYDFGETTRAASLKCSHCKADAKKD